MRYSQLVSPIISTINGQPIILRIYEIDHLRMEVKKQEGFIIFIEKWSFSSALSIFSYMLRHSLSSFSWSCPTYRLEIFLKDVLRFILEGSFSLLLNSKLNVLFLFAYSPKLKRFADLSSLPNVPKSLADVIYSAVWACSFFGVFSALKWCMGAEVYIVFLIS